MNWIWIAMGGVLILGMWWSISSKPQPKPKKKNSMEQNVMLILRLSKRNSMVQRTVQELLKQYENLSFLQRRLLRGTSSNDDPKQNFAQQMIEEQKQQIELKLEKLLNHRVFQQKTKND